MCGGPRYIDCPEYHQQRLQQRTQNRKGKGKGSGPRPAAHQWRVVQRPADPTAAPSEDYIAQDIALKGKGMADQQKGKGKSGQTKGKGKYEPSKGKEKGKYNPQPERVYYGDREWQGSWSYSWMWTFLPRVGSGSGILAFNLQVRKK